MASPLEVLPLDVAKAHLNEDVDDHSVDGELIPMIGAAVDRVRRHLGRDPGPARHVEVLAVQTVLVDYWATQRVQIGGTASFGAPGAAAEDTVPYGRASLVDRLTELLGPPAPPAGSSPTGSFPPPQPWPDPPRLAPRPRW